MRATTLVSMLRAGALAALLALVCACGDGESHAAATPPAPTAKPATPAATAAPAAQPATQPAPTAPPAHAGAGEPADAKFPPGQGPRIRGTVALDPQFAAAAAGHPLVIVLRSKAGGGMPIAVQKIDAPVFPVSFDLGPEHAPLQADDTPEILRGENKLLARVAVGGNVIAGPEDIECEPVLLKADQDPVTLTLDRTHGP